MSKWREIQRLVRESINNTGDYEVTYFIRFNPEKGGYDVICKITGFLSSKSISNEHFRVHKVNKEILLQYRYQIFSDTVSSFRRDRRLVEIEHNYYQVISAEEAEIVRQLRAQIPCCENCIRYRLVRWVGYRCIKQDGSFQKIPSLDHVCSDFIVKEN